MEETMSRIFPFKIENVDTNQGDELLKYFKGETTGFVRVGPKGYLLPHKYREEAADIYNMPLRAGDVFVDSYPRSGTTVTQELVWMVGNNLDYEKSRIKYLNERFPFLELSVLFDAKITQQLIDENRHDAEKLKKLEILLRPGTEKLAANLSPRYIKTHMPLSLLPAATLDTAKVVYVARDPRDVAVSFYHLNKLFRILGFDGDFKSFWRFFVGGLVHWAPYFDHVKEAWEKRHHPNLLFLFYEDIVKDMPQAVRRVSAFLEKQFSEEQTAQLCDYLRFDNFKDNNSVNENLPKELKVSVPGQQAFIRKGKSGGWREYFDEEMSAQAQNWIDDNLRGSDLLFPNNE